MKPLSRTKQTSRRQTTAGEIRIIGGKWRGRKLPVLDLDGLRPTTDRVKETLFNWLMPVIQQADCLDCFAGSGSLSFEAVSRGANSATLLEQQRAAIQILQQNQHTLQAQQLNIIQTDTLNWLARPAEKQFDLIFIDPPFHHNLINPVLQLLQQHQWLKAQAWIYIERETDSSAPQVPANWQLHRQKQAGQVIYQLYQQQ